VQLDVIVESSLLDSINAPMSDASVACVPRRVFATPVSSLGTWRATQHQRLAQPYRDPTRRLWVSRAGVAARGAGHSHSSGGRPGGERAWTISRISCMSSSCRFIGGGRAREEVQIAIFTKEPQHVSIAPRCSFTRRVDWKEGRWRRARGSYEQASRGSCSGHRVWNAWCRVRGTRRDIKVCARMDGLEMEIVDVAYPRKDRSGALRYTRRFWIRIYGMYYWQV